MGHVRNGWFSMLTLAVALAGCGGGSDAGGPGGFPLEDRTGEGSGSLAVEARIDASPSIDEMALDATELGTRFEVDVLDASGAAVTGATVVIDSPLGAVTLVEGGCERRYCGSQGGYAPVYELSVTRGADYLDDVVIHGPSFHRVTAPDAGGTVDAAEDLEVRWSPAGEAHRVEVETREMDVSLADDAGTFLIPADTLRTRDGESEQERIRVRRERRLSLTGGLSTSDIVVEVRNGIELFTQPAP